MSLNSIILKNFFKNLKNYSLYIFALVFSVVLYFSFVLLANDESTAEELASSQLMSTGFIVGSVMLIVIIVMFVMFANFIFLHRRNRELALFQLIGLTRAKIFRVLILENAVIYFGSLILGIVLGFLVSRMLLMSLLRVMQIELSVGMNFSIEAVIQTVVLFAFIFALLMAQNFLFLKRTQLIHMLTLDKTSEANQKRLGAGTVLLGILGLIMIFFGYWLSMNMFEFGEQFLLLMFSILFLTIAGTYLTFKFSVAFVLNVIRKSKNGRVNVNDVLSLTSIMFKMKSNAFLLTLISVISAVSMGLMSLSYISYYSLGQTVDTMIPHDYSFYEEEDLQFYSDLLDENDIAHETVRIPTVTYEADGEAISVDTKAPEGISSELQLTIVSEEYVDGFAVDNDELIITGMLGVMEEYIDLELHQPVTLVNNGDKHTLELKEIKEQTILPSFITFNSPQAVVTSEVYSTLAENHQEESAERQESLAIDIAGEDSQEIFQMMEEADNGAFDSKINQYTNQMQGTGMIMFVVGFVGFVFLLTSGCILYFKQIGESEDEKGSYNVLRKLGFSEKEMLKGLTLKMAVTFGVPLLVGLLHTYFAVNAGWFFFGSEIWIPMLSVMGAYIIIYSVFALISLMHYKKVVKESM